MSNRVCSLFMFFLVILFIGICPLAGLQSSPEELGTGLKLSTPEQMRGIPLAYTPYAGDELPPAVDLSKEMPPVGHQGRQNSCVGWSLAYALKSYQEKIEENLPYIRQGRLDFDRVFSPSFIYNQLNNGRNIPIYFRDAFNLLSNQGVATWADMPYREQDFTSQPTSAIREKAKRYRIDIWRKVNVLDTKEIKAHIHAGYPIVIGAKIDMNFKDLSHGKIWNSLGEVIGAHAMVVVGYSDRVKAFKLINSWGTNWGDDGFCWVDYDHFRKVVNEGFVAKDAINSTRPIVQPQPRPQPQPQPQPKPTQNATITVSRVEHNTYYPNRPDLGYFMKFEGTLYIPPGLGRTDQVVIHFYFDDGYGRKRGPVPSLDVHYADKSGFAACGTAVYPVPPEGLNTRWQSWIPYNALNVPVGRWVDSPQGRVYQEVVTYLIAEPMLFVDNFGVAHGENLRFYLRR